MLCPLGITFAPLWCAAVIFLSAFSLGCSIWLMRFYSGWWILGLCYHSLFYVAETYTALAGYSQTFLVGTSPGSASASAFSPSSSRFDSTFGLASQCRPLVQPCSSSSPPEGAQDGNCGPAPKKTKLAPWKCAVCRITIKGKDERCSRCWGWWHQVMDTTWTPPVHPRSASASNRAQPRAAPAQWPSWEWYAEPSQQPPTKKQASKPTTPRQRPGSKGAGSSCSGSHCRLALC